MHLTPAQETRLGTHVGNMVWSTDLERGTLDKCRNEDECVDQVWMHMPNPRSTLELGKPKSKTPWHIDSY